MKIAVVHDWLVTYAGAERALEQILLLYPEAELYALVDFLPRAQRSFILHKNTQTSFLQSLPFAKKNYRSYLPFMPLAIEQFDLSKYDLVLSSSHAVAKGVLTHARQLHVCYCYTPMRYAWDLHAQYLKEARLDKGLKGMFARLVLHYMRLWDSSTSNRVNKYIAISHYIGKRINKVYGRESAVIYPPVDTDSFMPGSVKEEYYLTASRMVPYKKIDLIAEAFSGMPDKKLVVIGDGPDMRKIKSRCGDNIILLGHQPLPVMKEYMQKARAFIFAAEEDFGIVTVEAQACGTPVIAFGRGGSLETVHPLRLTDHVRSSDKRAAATGVFFYEQTPEALKNAVLLFESNINAFDGKRIRENALRFGTERFRLEFKKFIDQALEEHSQKNELHEE